MGVKSERFALIFLSCFNPVPPDILDGLDRLCAMQKGELGVKIFLIDAHDEVFNERSVKLRVVDENLVVPRVEKPSENVKVLFMNVLIERRGIDPSDIG